MRYTDLPPPKVYRPVIETAPVHLLREKMSELVEQGVLLKRLGQYRLETLYVRETRVISRLGQSAIQKYEEALEKLAPASSSDRLTVPVTDVICDRSGAGGRRIVIRIEETDELLEERERALKLTSLMSGEVLPPLNFDRKISLGKLRGEYNNRRIESDLSDFALPSVVLGPTLIK